MRSSPGAIRFVLGVAALGLLLGLRLPFMAPAVDDLDSTNFHEGILRYSPVAHRPHPPGFPVFIAAAKGLYALTGSPVTALTLLSAVSGAFAVVPLFVIARQLFRADTAAVACAVFAFIPVVWFAGVRPMSDATGVFFGLTALALLLSGLDASRPSANVYWMSGVVVAGLAVGVRLQLLVLVAPLLLYGWAMRLRGIVTTPLLFTAAVLAWWLPMLEHSGGFDRYARAFRHTMTEAASWEPLLRQMTPERAIEGLRHVALMPWITPFLAVPVLVLAATGFLRAARHERRALGTLLMAFGPYAVFNYFVQNTQALRYVIPATPLVAILAAIGLTGLAGRRRTLVPVVVGAYVAAAAVVMVPALSAYRRSPAPALQALNAIPRDGVHRPVISGAEVFTRYVAFAPPDAEVLSPRGGDGWRRVANYWGEGGQAPVHYLFTPGDPVRTLVSPEAVTDAGRFDWAEEIRSLMSGERPNEVRMIRMEPPTWFALRRRTEPGTRRATFWLFVRAAGVGRNVLLQGRSTDDVPRTYTLLVDGDVRDEHQLDNQFMLQARARGEGPYSELEIRAGGPIEVTRILAAAPDESLFLPLRGIHRADTPEGRFHWLASEAEFIAHVPRRGTSLTLTGDVSAGRARPSAFRVTSSDGEFLVAAEWSGASFRLSFPLRPASDPFRTVTLVVADAAGYESSALRLTGIDFDEDADVASRPQTRPEDTVARR